MALQSDHTTGTRTKKAALGIGGGLAALAVLGAVGGCGSSSKNPNSSAAAGTGTTAATAGTAGTAGSSGGAAADTSITTPGDGPFSFGRAYGGNGEKVSVSAPTAFTPTASAAGTTAGDSAYYVTVQVSNTGSTTLDVSLLQVEATVGAKGAAAANIIDSGTAVLGSTGGSSTPFASGIAPGASRTGEVAFDVPAADKGKIDVEVSNLTLRLHWVGQLS